MPDTEPTPHEVPDAGEVWYVSYGSNMAFERLVCYIEGGCPPGGVRTNPGARDPNLPSRSIPVELPGARPLTDPWRRDPIADGPTLPAAGSLLEVDGDLEVTAVKRAEERDELVVRLLNQSGGARTARLRPHRPVAGARRLDLAEQPSEDGDVTVSDGMILVEAGPWELVTVGIGLAE